MAFNLAWVDAPTYEVLRSLDARGVISLPKRGIGSILQATPDAFTRFSFQDLKEICKELRSKNLFSASTLAMSKDEMLESLTAQIQERSPHKNVFANDSRVLHCLREVQNRRNTAHAGRSNVNTTAAAPAHQANTSVAASISAPIAAPIAPGSSAQLLTFLDVPRLLVHITHLRRFRLATNPYHEFVEPIGLIRFDRRTAANTIASTKSVEYRAYLPQFVVPHIAPNERIIARLFGQRPPFRVKISNLEDTEIPIPHDLDYSTVLPYGTPITTDASSVGFMDPKYRDMPYLRAHPGARGNDPIVDTSAQYPTEIQDKHASKLLREGVMLPFLDRMQGQVAVWVNTKSVDIKFMETKTYHSRFLNKYKKKATHIIEGVDITDSFKDHALGSKLPFEIAWNRENNHVIDQDWSGCVIIEKVRVRTLAEVEKLLLSLPKVDLLPTEEDLFDLAAEQQKRPRRCGHCGQEDGVVRVQRCSGCRLEWYCCREHQVAHWPIHRPECNRLYKILRAQEEKRKLQAKNKSEDEDELEVDDSQTVLSLLCPVSQARMRIPVKGIMCPHPTCMELSSFLAISTSGGVMQCQICSREVRVEELAISEKTAEALKRLPESVTEVVCPRGQPYQPYIKDDIAPPHAKRANMNTSRPQQMVSLGAAASTPVVAPPTTTSNTSTAGADSDAECIELD